MIEKGITVKVRYTEGGWDLIEVQEPFIVPIGADDDHSGFILGRRLEASLQLDVPEFWVEDADPPEHHFPGDWILVPHDPDNRR